MTMIIIKTQTGTYCVVTLCRAVTAQTVGQNIKTEIAQQF